MSRGKRWLLLAALALLAGPFAVACVGACVSSITARGPAPAVVHVQRPTRTPTVLTAPLPTFRLSPTTAPRAGTQTISCRPGATCVPPTQLTS